MKQRTLAVLLAAFSFLGTAVAAQPDTNIQTSPLATVRLLATGHTSGGGSPDGMQFLFMITPGAGVVGAFSLKETRDFTVGGTSYQEKTQAELGQRFEPRTSFDTAEGFFAKQPGMRQLAPDDIKDARILVLALGGTKIPVEARVEITVNVGFAKTVEPFTFSVTAPPSPAAAPKQ